MSFFNFDHAAAGWVTGYDNACDAPPWYSVVSKANMTGRPARGPAFGRFLAFARDYSLTLR